MSDDLTVEAPSTEGRLPAGWSWSQLGDECQINPRRPAISRLADAPTTFVPMAAVAEEGRGIDGSEIRPYADVAKGYTYFEEGDVLFAKITPCMQNGKHAITRNLIDGMGLGSTEFHIVWSGSNVTPEWIHLFLIQPWVLSEAMAHFTVQWVNNGYRSHTWPSFGCHCPRFPSSGPSRRC
ncbi:MAG: hypothetical protein M3Q10_02715 [Chloroflexota bacterium]|nr:hypothetical protein [Chloroflexota bacterium]